jgi:hypothetical protein
MHPEYDGWKRMKFKSYDKYKMKANMRSGSFIDSDFPHTNASIS